METKITSFCLFLAMMRLSPAEELKRNLTGVVGGNITLPDPLMEEGFILDAGKANNLAMVTEGNLKILDDKFNNKLLWNKDSGLFTITDLQKIDSGVYKIDDKKREISFSYSLSVYDAAPTPAVETRTVSSDSCWLICSVDKPTSLMWYKDEEIQNQSSSAVSLPITVYRQDRDSSYRCVAANPAENKTLHVNVTTSCWFIKTESGDKRIYWITPLVSVGFVIIIAFITFMMKQRYLGKKTSDRQTQGRSRKRTGSPIYANSYQG
ncbi:CD48 antigen-like isoform X2 [Cyprinodon tularosa]|uniref:CD48 antigen-like isoform X2 n=1 Tax=Cyprinodon tularosa TaxID=77115 RepID=UPI0018E2597B|nr:CD48 antigen-like isoform X2 [Cyprinodon tularosa]